MTTRSLSLALLVAFAILVFFGYSANRKLPELKPTPAMLGEVRTERTSRSPKRFPAVSEMVLAGVRQPQRWSTIVIHHSGTVSGSAGAFDRYHRQMGDANGIKYHFVIGNGQGMPDGSIEATDRWRRQIDAAHLYLPQNAPESIAICLVGNFQESKPTEQQSVSTVKLCYVLMQRFDIPAERVFAHREVDVNKTVCPGQRFSIDVLREALLVLSRQDAHTN